MRPTTLANNVKPQEPHHHLHSSTKPQWVATLYCTWLWCELIKWEQTHGMAPEHKLRRAQFRCCFNSVFRPRGQRSQKWSKTQGETFDFGRFILKLQYLFSNELFQPGCYTHHSASINHGVFTEFSAFVKYSLKGKTSEKVLCHPSTCCT